MNKQQFIKAFAEKAQFTQKDAGIAFEAMAETIAETLKSGETIQIAGFGTFSVKTKAAKEGINPLTKEKVSVPEKEVPVFKFGDSFRKTIAKNWLFVELYWRLFDVCQIKNYDKIGS